MGRERFRLETKDEEKRRLAERDSLVKCSPDKFSNGRHASEDLLRLERSGDDA